jgi:hypothetical protein
VSVAIEQSFVQSATALGPQLAARVWRFVGQYMNDKSQPGISLERLGKLRTKGLWSARVSQDVRAIVFRDGAVDYLLYVDHHDPAYAWAERRQVVHNPRTNAIQIFTAVEEIEHRGDELPASDGDHPEPLFAGHRDDYLLSLGLPDEWLPFIRAVSDIDDLLEAVDNLPDDVAGRLLEVADGHVVAPPAPRELTIATTPLVESTDGTISPEADDLERLLAAPLSTWIAFLHPSQRDIVTADFSGPAKVTGTAGTGKTVVALHRARNLARSGRRVLITSYVNVLCDNIERSLGVLCSAEELARIEVRTVHQVAREMVRLAGAEPRSILGDDDVRDLIERYSQGHEPPLGRSGLLAEWNLVVQAQGVVDWDGYRVANRAGRGTPLSAAQRQAVWGVLGRVRDHMVVGQSTDWQGLCMAARELVSTGAVSPPWDSVIVDEVQDLSAQALRLVAVLGGSGPNGLMVLGDGGQRIYAHRTSLRSAGVEVRGRARVLRLNYRTTEEIRRFADRIISASDDLDEEAEERGGCRSLRPGVAPDALGFSAPDEQYDYVAEHVLGCLEGGAAPREIAVLARTATQLRAADSRLERAGVATHRLQPNRDAALPDAVQLVTMHSAKGLEFKIGVVIDASAATFPNRYAVNQAGDDQDRAEAIERERQLLYVALTRARDEVLVTWVGEPCGFLAPALAATRQPA